MRNKKGQAAMEFLTTYGWAFLVIIVAVAGLSYFGVFNFSKYLQTSCVLDGKLECGEAFALTNTTVAMQIKNNNMQAANITGINILEQSMADTGSSGCPHTGTIVGKKIINSGSIEDLTFTIDETTSCGLAANQGQKKKFLVEISYQIGDSKITSISSGAITAVVQ